MRSESVTVKALNREGRPFRVKAKDDLLAQALEHELDHLDGILYIDYLESADQLINLGPGKRPGRRRGSSDTRPGDARCLRVSLSPSVRRLLSKLRAVWLEDDADGYLIGGFLRDLLLDRAVRDIDVALSGDAPSLARLAADAVGGTCFALDEERGITRIVLPARAPVAYVDVTRLRGDIESDLAERDFTIDAMALPLEAVGRRGPQPLIDPFSGADDVDDGSLGRSATRLPKRWPSPPARRPSLRGARLRPRRRHGCAHSARRRLHRRHRAGAEARRARSHPGDGPGCGLPAPARRPRPAGAAAAGGHGLSRRHASRRSTTGTSSTTCWRPSRRSISCSRKANRRAARGVALARALAASSHGCLRRGRIFARRPSKGGRVWRC